MGGIGHNAQVVGTLIKSGSVIIVDSEHFWVGNLNLIAYLGTLVAQASVTMTTIRGYCLINQMLINQYEWLKSDFYRSWFHHIRQIQL